MKTSVFILRRIKKSVRWTQLATLLSIWTDEFCSLKAKSHPIDCCIFVGRKVKLRGFKNRAKRKNKFDEHYNCFLKIELNTEYALNYKNRTDSHEEYL